MRVLRQCNSCRLRYFDLIPERETLLNLYRADAIVNYWNDSDARKLREKLESVLPNVPVKGHAAVLDIGCHTGKFLRCLPLGWSKVGIDPNRDAIDWARTNTSAIEFVSGHVEDAALPIDAFDIVTAFDVFEHVESVSGFVAEVARTLRTGGYLVLETGNYASRYARLAGLIWYYYSPLDHTVFFAPNVIQSCLERAGIRLVSLHMTAHARRSITSRLSAFSAILAVAMYSAGGRWQRIHSSLARWSGRNGALPDPGFKDHMLVVGQRVV
jgi:2-polyprenyl-3-methyl-5-hydroxy-6-metoxy-1,4-benzoquinol methylase